MEIFASNILLLAVSNLLSTPTLCAVNFYSNKSYQYLKGKHFRIATLDVRPYMYLDTIDENANAYRADGIVYNIILWLSVRFDFTFTLVLPPDRTFGGFVNKSWNGMIGLAVARQVELIAAPMVPSLDRAQILDFTTAFSEEPMCCLIPAPEVDGNMLTSIVKPFNRLNSCTISNLETNIITFAFDLKVWNLIIISMLGVAIVIRLISKLESIFLSANLIKNSSISNPKTSDRKWSLIEHLFAVFRIICLQPNERSSTRSSFSIIIVLSTWCLGCVVLVYVYTGSLTSHMAIPRSKPIVSSVEELANSTRLQVALIKSSIFESTLMESTSGPLSSLGNQLRRNPENRLSGEYYNLSKLLEKAESGRYAVMLSRSQAETVMGLDWEKNGRCRFSIMDEEILPARFCFALPKGSPHAHFINLGLMMMYDSGLLQIWRSRSVTAAASHCKNPKIKSNIFVEIKKPLSLQNLSGAFFLLLMGVSVSFSAFVLEILTPKF